MAARFHGNSWAALENTAQALLLHHCAQNHRSGVFRSDLALEIAALEGFWFFDSTRKHCTGAGFSHIASEITPWACSAASHLQLELAAPIGFFVFGITRKHSNSAALSHIPLEVTAQSCPATTWRSKSLLGRASKPSSARNHCSSKPSFSRLDFFHAKSLSKSSGLNCALLRSSRPSCHENPDSIQSRLGDSKKFKDICIYIYIYIYKYVFYVIFHTPMWIKKLHRMGYIFESWIEILMEFFNNRK